MATSSLLHIANRQLRLLLLQKSCIVAMVTQPHRFCQDDSKQRKKINRKVKESNKKHDVVKATGPAVSLLERDLQHLVEEKQNQLQLQQRSSLQCRLDLLLSLGCTMDQIQDRVSILEHSEKVILDRATLLKRAGCQKITVDLLLTSSHTRLDKLQQSLQRQQELERVTCSVLQCSPAQLEGLKRQHPSLRRMRCLTGQAVLEKVTLLNSYGVTQQEIQDCPSILNIRINNLKQRLDLLKKLREEGSVTFAKYPLNVLTQRTRSFDNHIKRALSQSAQIDGSPIAMETIAQHLGVTLKELEDASFNFYKMGPSRVLQKINYLLAQGISSNDILSHIYIMKYHLHVLQEVVEKSKEMMVSHAPSIYIVLSLLRSGRIPKKSFICSRQRMYVASLLGIQKKSLPVSKYFRPLWSAERICIKRNFDFLLSEEFSVQDISSCLILLAHDPAILQDYYRRLWQRPELAGWPGSEAWSKKQTLSLLQYIMEKDMNFSSVVFHAEVEYDQASTPGQEPPAQEQLRKGDLELLEEELDESEE